MQLVDVAKGMFSGRCSSFIIHAFHQPIVLSIFLACERFNLFRDTVWLQATYNVLKELGDLTGRTKDGTWTYVNSAECNAWGDASLPKGSAEQAGSGFSMPPNMTLCEELQFLDIWSDRVGFALEESA